MSSLVGLGAVEIFCTVCIHAKYFLLFLQQRKLVLSQISLVTMGTASQPGGNVMGRKSVPTARMSQKQHAVSSSQWCLQTCSAIKAQRNWSFYSQHLQEDLSVYACARTKFTDTKDSGHSNHTVYKLSDVPVFQTVIQAVLSGLDFCLQGNCKHLELLVRLMISSSGEVSHSPGIRLFGNSDLVFCMVTYWDSSSLQTALLLFQMSFAM